MNYQEVMNYFENGLISNRKMQNKMKFDLGKLYQAAEAFGNPQNSYNIVHVAGTKGKGSICAYLSKILQERYRVGLHLSPYLYDYREQIQVNDKPISKNDFIHIISKIKQWMEQSSNEFSLSQHEVGIIATLIYFMESNVEWAVIETGMGGRYDSSNIVSSNLSVIASISKDHVQVLGDTLEEITWHKAGIIKQNGLTISAPQYPEVIKVLNEQAYKVNSEIYYIGHDIVVNGNNESFTIQSPWGVAENLSIQMKGINQLKNAACAVSSILLLREQGLLEINNEQIKNGLYAAFLPGRFEILENSPLLVVDGAHNEDSIRDLLETVKAQKVKRCIMILAVQSHKDIKGIADKVILGADAVILYNLKQNIGSEAMETLMSRLCERKIYCIIKENAATALNEARTIANKDDCILVTGSFYTVAEIRELLLGKPVLHD